MRIAFLSAAIVLLSSAAPHAEKWSEDKFRLYIEAIGTTPPSEWSAEQMEIFRGPPESERRVSPACTMTEVAAMRLSNGQGFDDDSLEVIRTLLSEKGYEGRDLEVLSNPAGAYGAGMTFTGLKCALDQSELRVNKSFSVTAGHRWQVVTPGGRFIYLEGDGTESGMLVVGWN